MSSILILLLCCFLHRKYLSSQSLSKKFDTEGEKAGIRKEGEISASSPLKHTGNLQPLLHLSRSQETLFCADLCEEWRAVEVHEERTTEPGMCEVLRSGASARHRTDTQEEYHPPGY